MTDFIQISITCPNQGVAQSIAQTLVKQQLVACAQISQAVTSIYQWQGKIEQEAEFVLQLKSHLSLFESVAESINQQHPYDVPEIIALPLIAISEDYRTWLAQICLSETD